MGSNFVNFVNFVTRAGEFMPHSLDKMNQMKKADYLDFIPDSTINDASRVYEIDELYELSPAAYGDGQPPPLNRPPVTEQEPRRLHDHWRSEPGAFTKWLERAMTQTDPAEGN